MAAPNDTTQTLTATVEAVNERGIKVNGGWLNVSKYASVALPMRGALVALEVKDGRWIQRCDVLDGQEAHSAPQRAVAAPGCRERTIHQARRFESRGHVRGEPPRCEVPRRAHRGRHVAAVGGGGGGRGIEARVARLSLEGAQPCHQELPTLLAYPARQGAASTGTSRW